jgi:hypothetical protein
MNAQIGSKFLLRKVLVDFDKWKDLPNQKYLEFQINRLEQMLKVYRAGSTDKTLSARIRARNRDLEQNCMGLINGIKFSISFWQHKNKDLAELEGLSEVVDGKNSTMQ